MGQSLRTLKGVGEKTEKLFWKVGIYDTDDLLHYYPRNYDEYETPVDIAELKEGTVQAVSAAVCSGVYVNSVKGTDHFCEYSRSEWEIPGGLVQSSIFKEDSPKGKLVCFSRKDRA